ncbi:hybrid sensor histidine kinase/response regulator [cyanobacterium endosymbiont of Epithemia clementina EcSB]|uniref:hybrid sensor histidine kinase/response regulator n=1 Tax=cyanobacterium endosymbiont of Epithemia clementina EcSB TaxID=3034674 RepID=UPI0024819764|nr:hybrid sensor histidine kinase/response regulator [cyanobacterium endosymbiont of Epithemia clementina EcSB]WGT68271.1 hybrid sensor histidine kinase/response regulator [cyanobacterium endosymbiont of Epithemia clementina EcSB]
MILEKGNLLVVDDTLDNLRLLSAMLSEQGYKVRKALNGQMALKTVSQVPPDVILLDINMTGINGYEVCQTLKDNHKTKEIPVIFISALDDILDKVKAFEVGGVDYICKPFQEEEVIARVENQLTIQRQKKQLQQEIKERKKTEQTLRVYLHAVSHDLRNPVLGMAMVLKNLLKKGRKENKPTIEMSNAVLEQIVASCDRQLNLINSLVETQQFEMGGVCLNCTPLDLFSLSQKLAAEWQPILKEHKGILDVLISPELPVVNGDSDRLWRVFENLLANALKHNPPGLKLTINAEVLTSQKSAFYTQKVIEKSSQDKRMVICILADDGVGMNSEQAENLFERYHRGDGAKKTLGLGLGLYLCRQIIEAHGGEIGVITNPNAGAKFWFTLPVFDSLKNTN